MAASATLTNSATRVILRRVRRFPAFGVGTCCGDVALGKNHKIKKPASERGFAPSPDAKSPPAELEVRAPNPPLAKAENIGVGGEAAAGRDKGGTDRARLVHRDGVAFVEGCEIPVWRLEMARRAGSDRAALTKAFPGLTSLGLDLAFAYARRHRSKLDKLIGLQGAAVPAGDEGPDDASAFEAELKTLFDKNAEVFRRLAQ